ncbi:hypothetical protein CAPTEDRAFT_191266 [Capitella teleta]|uniref:Transmembrane protein n=1 Tax=Capitella teleta TaxID=283909 RepID=R7U655_CAPTE|nr:hypothetical protein CAPTEDRAFT_191266 [Capitella teleta]|eukprot:ELU01845.1 hypothetical protein CAPTEDRAFT_191266 [Capitella teleta]
MVCCMIPCFEEENDGVVTSRRPIVAMETIRWSAIVIPIMLSVWRYVSIRGYPDVLSSATPFWLTVSGTILAISLLIYVPSRIALKALKTKLGRLRDGAWRPSIVAYIILCVLPSFALILVAVETEPGSSMERMDATTITVLQATVMGLTITEWVSKVREEPMTFDLVGAMTMDFFFAYDVIAFIMMSTYEADIYHSDWVYVCFLFSFVAMFKYVPTQPVSIMERTNSRGHVTCIVVSLVCSDVPFLVIRLATMIHYGFLVSDLIFPVKNLALILFQGTQLYMIYTKRIGFERRVDDAVPSEEHGGRGKLEVDIESPERGKGSGEIGFESCENVGECSDHKPRVVALMANEGIVRGETATKTPDTRRE